MFYNFEIYGEVGQNSLLIVSKNADFIYCAGKEKS